MTFYPRRQWISKLYAYSGVTASDDPREAPVIYEPRAGTIYTTFVYASSPLSLSVGVPMTPASPTLVPNLLPTGHFHPTYTLPPGLVLDIGSGVISGTPTAAQAATNHEINADAHVRARTFVNITIAP